VGDGQNNFSVMKVAKQCLLTLLIGVHLRERKAMRNLACLCWFFNNAVHTETIHCYDRMINECKAVGGVRIGMGI
jgi:hypothetical protein